MNNSLSAAILEREGIIALDLKELLRRFGYQNINFFKDIPDLLNHLSENPTDLIIMDSPEESVYEKIKFITENYNSRIIFLTEMTEQWKIFSRMKKCSCLRKPFERNDLVKLIQKSL
jgi:DNA-binding response OmpR family regulator